MTSIIGLSQGSPFIAILWVCSTMATATLGAKTVLADEEPVAAALPRFESPYDAWQSVAARASTATAWDETAADSKKAEKPAVPLRLPPRKLSVFVLQGQGAVNSIQDRRGTTPVVEVRDQNGASVDGAEVVFTLPQSGPGGFFGPDQLTAKVRSRADGQVAAPFIVNGQAGKFQIQVAATLGEQFGSAIISQSNSLRATESGGKKTASRWYKSWKVWAIAGGAAAATVAALLLTRGGDSKPTITISSGGPIGSHP
jgi:hypothetical protein